MWYKWKNIKVNYEIVGEGKPILMIHGYTPDHRLMMGCMEPIFDAMSNYKRVYIDLPGMGRTEGSDQIKNSDDMLEVVRSFVNEIIGSESFLVAGESYGGYLTRGLIHEMPDQIEGALFICAMIKPHDRVVPHREIILKNPELLARLSDQKREMYESIAVVQDERTWEHFKTYVMPGLLKADEVFLERLRADGYGFTFDDALASDVFEKPVLFLNGKQDTSVGYKDAWGILDLYPRGTYVALDRAGHSLEAEQSVLFNALVKEWLFRCEEANDERTSS
ncbi:alpha/beta fold hydrolase [Fusibacter ferrireducens]|uniref:Alpha/beta hydrolase n=1 Tax=Fusibacter ferrireducens TaxID=2785058 RepID=A0ABR9ZQ90_9FIRM|nr:alpha/beta hydrolase [Fusibacter ferrireducens]MBF4692630.1 alpha/beta hydrolase [Fusibacter ferrireducens]